jgi:hypothetical protein
MDPGYEVEVDRSDDGQLGRHRPSVRIRTSGVSIVVP